MRVLHLCTKVPFPPKDGGSLAIAAFTSLLKQSNFDVTVLAANTPKHRVTHNENSDGVKLHSVSVNTNIRFCWLLLNLLFSKTPYQISRFKDIKFKKYLKELLSKENFDIVQMEGPHLGLYLPLIKRYSSAKIVLRAHNVEYMMWNDVANETKSFPKKYYLKLTSVRLKNFESDLISNVDAVIPITNNDLQNILSFSKPKKTIVIPFGIDLSKYIPTNTRHNQSLFFIGALDWIPNQTGLIWFLDNVWHTTKKNNPNVSFHVAGRNAPSWIKQRLIAEDIIFYGEVDDSKDFMNRFQIMIAPIFSGSGVRIKILEGMALKKPIITTLKGAEGLNVTNEKELIIIDDPLIFSSKIKELITDKLKQDSLGEAARAFICKEFDNLALANKIQAFYHEII